MARAGCVPGPPSPLGALFPDGTARACKHAGTLPLFSRSFPVLEFLYILFLSCVRPRICVSPPPKCPRATLSLSSTRLLPPPMRSPMGGLETPCTFEESSLDRNSHLMHLTMLVCGRVCQRLILQGRQMTSRISATVHGDPNLY